MSKQSTKATHFRVLADRLWAGMMCVNSNQSISEPVPALQLSQLPGLHVEMMGLEDGKNLAPESLHGVEEHPPKPTADVV